MIRCKQSVILASALLATVLTACGGGGGGNGSTSGASSIPSGSTPSTPSVPSTPIPAATSPDNTQSSVPAPTYAAGSQELALFNQLNDFRSKLGLGLLTQSAAMDTADQNHLKYILANQDINYGAIDPKTGLPYFHSEDPTRSGYTGATPLDRAKFAGYTGSAVAEQGSYGQGSGATTALNDLIASVYHRQGLMYQFPRDVGIAIGTDGLQTTVLNIGVSGALQKNASNYFGVYPADKQTGVGLTTRPESPNPYSDLALSDFATKTSYPVCVTSEASTTLAVTSFTITEAGQTTPLDVRLLTADNDPKKLLAKNIAFAVGKAPFKSNTTYNVSFAGTVNGAAVSKTWGFTTGQ